MPNFRHFPPMTKDERAELLESYRRHPPLLGDHEAYYFHAAIHNREIVMAVMEKMGWMLQHAADFRRDPEVVMTAVRQNWRAAQFAAPGLLHDTEFLTRMALVNPRILIYSRAGVHQLEHIFDAVKVEPAQREEILEERETLMRNRYLLDGHVPGNGNGHETGNGRH